MEGFRADTNELDGQDMLTSSEIRSKFLDFFKSKEHEIVSSAPVVPQDDPTLMFTNAGMNQFKDVFLGQGNRPYSRAVDTQKCIRVSGKHNDLEEVGRDGYHHTFFEMLGNWSFGDYYKKEACSWAWEFLTEVIGLDEDRLYITVYRTDEEAMEIWKNITGFGEDRIQRFDEKDNFWEMGEVGPCGPCTEIHYDRTPDKSGIGLVNADSPSVMEIWNLVFIQYNRKQDGRLEELPSKHVDTGMGFERLVSVVQDTRNNYDTDIFTPILSKIGELSGAPYKSGNDDSIPHQVIADHIRMITFSIADGALPANEGRGYVVRRILRRAARFGRKLGLKDAFLYTLIDVLCDCYGETFPELPAQRDFITQVIKAEESSFKKNLDRGIGLFSERADAVEKGGMLSGKDAFVLYDTYGFPVDMTSQMCEERGLQLDMEEYNSELEAAKERSREGAGSVTADWIILNKRDDSEFIGYDHLKATVKIDRYRATGEKDEDGRDIYQIMLTESPFYAESGGQVGDCGTLSCDSFVANVLDTKKIDGRNVCIAVVTAGEIVDEEAVAEVDATRRSDIKRNHSATHLLHQALKEVLGDHVQQKGSLVNEKNLRFDFSHFQAVNSEELKKIERIVNAKILANLGVEIDLKPIDEAKAMGAQALFGEKYGDVVRLVQMGDYSMELCGGCHVDATGDVGFLKITSESSISAGIRRIEAVTGVKAYELAADMFDALGNITASLKCSAEDTPERVESLMAKVKQLEKENTQLKQKILVAEADEIISKAEVIDGVKVLAVKAELDDVEALKNMGHNLRNKIGTGVCLVGAEINGKAMLVVAVTDDLVEKGVKSGAIINPVARIVGGGGGGHPRFAQAGGKNPGKLDEAIAAAPAVIKENL